MNRFSWSYKFSVCVFLSLCLVFSSCTAESELPSVPQKKNLSATAKPKERDTKGEKSTESIKTFEGCWSSFNGNWLIIENGQLRTSVNSFDPVDFKVLEYNAGPRSVVLELTNRPNAYYFRRLVKLELGLNDSGDTELRDDNFDTIDQLKQGEALGSDRWVNDSCKVSDFDKSRIGEISGSDEP